MNRCRPRRYASWDGPRIVLERRLPDGLIDATVHKHREDNRVVAVEQRRVFGSSVGLEEASGESTVSHRVNTSFIERQNGTDRGATSGRPARRIGSARTGGCTRR